MSKKASLKPSRARLVVYIDAKEQAAVLRDAHSLGIKNAHRWAAMKLAPSLREATERFR